MTGTITLHMEAVSACQKLRGALDPLDDLISAANKSEITQHLLIARVLCLKRDLDVELAQLSAAIDAR